MRPITKRDMDDFRTPPELYRCFDEINSFDCDVAASDENALCERYFTKDDNALFQEWSLKNWCNPPYSSIAPWIEKALIERDKGRATVMLLPVRTSNGYFSTLLENCQILFIRGRLYFTGPHVAEGGCSAESSMICIFSPNKDFKPDTYILEPWEWKSGESEPESDRQPALDEWA